jgi:hypothetical protein
VDRKAIEDEVARSRAAWRTATVAAALNAFGVPLDMLITRAVVGRVLWESVASAAFGAVLFVALVLGRRAPKARLAGLAFLANACAIAAAIWFSNGAYAASGRPWVPFQANKLGVITVALLAPELWVGALSIAVYAGAAIVQLSTFDAHELARLAIGEPWATIAFSLFSLVLLFHRERALALEREVVRMRSERSALERLAKILLTIRDVAGTPLQTLAFVVELARQKHPDLAPALGRAHHAIERLRDLDGLFKRYEHLLTWAPGEARDLGREVGGAEGEAAEERELRDRET